MIISLDEFKTLVARTDWIQEYSIEWFEKLIVDVDGAELVRISGIVNKHSKLPDHAIEITYSEEFDVFEGDEDSLVVGDDSLDVCWDVANCWDLDDSLVVVDENDQVINDHDLCSDYLPAGNKYSEKNEFTEMNVDDIWTCILEHTDQINKKIAQ